jgi:phosphomannomutase/phosphoglucomutase
MILYARDVLRRNPGASIIYDVKCSRHLARAIAAAGGKPIMWKTGHSLMKAKLRETGALLAGEMSGHIYFQERWYGFDDGLYSAARLLEILSAHRGSTAELFSALPDSLNTPELNLALAEGDNFRFMEKLASRANFAGARVTRIDGLRVEFDDGWGLVRPSNTTPSLVVRFEAEDVAALQRIQDIFRREMLKTQPDLHLPF